MPDERNRPSRFPLREILLALAVALSAGSCLPAFDVNVATPEPIAVDVDMDVHVYQHGKVDEKTSQAQASYRAAMDARRDRMAEVQELKNNRLVGENHLGELAIRNLPAGEYGQYVSTTVADENRDRVFLMKHESEEKGTPLEQVREEQWRHWLRKSFPGEWIEVAADGGGYRWEQKKKAGE